MANRYFQEKLLSLNHNMVLLEGHCVISSGDTGKTKSLKGSGLSAITWKATGTYKVQLEDPYARFLGIVNRFTAGVTGSTAVHSSGTPLTIGTLYVIATLGTTTTAEWNTLGVPVGVTPAVGVPFVALTTGTGSGTGTVSTSVPSGSYKVEVIGDPNLTINNTSDPHMYIQVMGPTVGGASSPNASPAPVDPLDGSVMGFVLFFRNSSVVGKGE